jgi:hypothetical protein
MIAKSIRIAVLARDYGKIQIAVFYLLMLEILYHCRGRLIICIVEG